MSRHVIRRLFAAAVEYGTGLIVKLIILPSALLSRTNGDAKLLAWFGPKPVRL